MTLPAPAARPAVGAFVAIFAAVLAAAAWGHEGTRIVQVALLALPGLAWLLWPLASPAQRRWRAIGVAAWAALFVVDGVVRGHVWTAFHAAAHSSMVISAIANTSARESAEFVKMYLPALVLSAAALVGLMAVVGAAAWWSVRPARGPALAPQARRRLAWGLALVMLVCAVAYASKPARRWHPLPFWIGWAAEVRDLRASWADREAARAESRARARAALGTQPAGTPATVVLVLGESVNRDNLQLYGYPRATSPRLASHKQELQDALLVLRHAWSAEPGTLASLQGMMLMGEPAATEPQHLLALAQAAGYKVWWISNHDDLGIEKLHARMADEVRMLNHMPGRATAALDEITLPVFGEALADPTPRKLIVLHLLGAHPHYRLRFPEGPNPFSTQPDGVHDTLRAQGRPEWLRRLRDDYDAALRYHDEIVARTLAMTRSGVPPGSYAAWLYVSDHGQEVAHETDRAGHSETTAAGYRIPALVWQSAPRRPVPPEAAQRPFRADWVGWTLAHLLDVQWHGHQAARDVLDPAYRWDPPPVRAPVRDFQR